MAVPNSFDARLQLPFSCIVCGPSNSGKSFFIKMLLENCTDSMSKIPDRIVWCYTCWQPLYDELMDKLNIYFVQGIPESLCDDELFPPHKTNLLVIDDLMESASKSEEVEKAFTKYTHHRNLSVIYLVQNLFFQGRSSRTINLNTNYMVLFKNPRDKLQINVLARQMYPRNSKYFLECFQDATSRPYGYLLVDLKASTPEDLRLRSGLFFTGGSCGVRTEEKGFRIMSDRLKRNYQVLKSLHQASPRERKLILRQAPTDLVLAICEIALNLLRGRIPLTAQQYARLKRQKKAIKLFADKRKSVKVKRNTINQSGGFLLPLLSVAVPFISSLIAARQK
ncbi:uncharacterized protein LOC125805028 isoform X2 [Astyanax mexicanus]|uniref:uncharacterized protein LOC125805028 isoform X2 n=1 Tax=Astyanax mexicanus TaxID=7994 RepID=UPI0020CA9D4C|nr:uncharacterized protein LOC125805028 isoform X2 [Astyanax mexicanus]